jgi:pyrroline-5-carboxylate reductase
MAIEPLLALVGGGNMSQAIVRGGLEAGILDPARMVIADPEPAKREWYRTLGIATVETASAAIQWLNQRERGDGWTAGSTESSTAGQVLLAVKPQSLMEVGRELAPPLKARRRIVLSILAGAPSASIRAAVGDAAIIRIMPNLAVQIRRGITAIAQGEGAADGDDDVAIALFEALGRTVRIEEDQMNAFTAVAGSGPAYLFYLAEAMTRAAMEVGFDRDSAQWIVRWTLTGSAALMDATDQPPATLRAAVTSKGGTTAAATAVLDEAQVMEAFVRAIAAARDRGAELGG